MATTQVKKTKVSSMGGSKKGTLAIQELGLPLMDKEEIPELHIIV